MALAPAGADRAGGVAAAVVGPAGLAPQVAELVPPRRAPHVGAHPDPFVKHRPQQVEAAELVTLKNLSVRETEKLVQRMSMGQNKKVISINQEYQTKAAKWNTLLSRKFSSNVNVNLKSDGKGKVVFQFESIEEAEWLIDNLMDTDLCRKG